MSSAARRSYFWPLTLLLLAMALAGGIIFWLSQSTLLAVENIEISGNHVLSDEQVQELIGPELRGQSLLKLSYDDATFALRDLPFVKAVEIKRDFPHTLHVEIFEYRPVACYTGADSSYFLSDDGRVLSIIEQPDTSLPVLTTAEPCSAELGGHMDCADVQTGIDFLISVPVNLNQEFTRVMVSNGVIDAATLTGVEVHFGTLDDHAYKFDVLRQLIARTIAAGEQVIIDLSVPDRPVTRSKNAPAPATPPDEAAAEDAGEEAVTAPDGAAVEPEPVPELDAGVVE